MSELLRALGVLAEPPTAGTATLTHLLKLPPPPDAAAHTDLFLFQLYPYASVYLGAEGMVGGAARDRVAGFWRALGEEPPEEPDHLTTLLAFYASLREPAHGDGKRVSTARRRAAGAFLWEHLLPWLPPFLAKAEQIAPPFYRSWATLLRRALAEEARRFAPPEELPLHLRRAPELGDPRREGATDWLRDLLAPVRSGILLVAADLRRLAADKGLGTRVAERHYALQAILGQDAPGALDWLAGESRRWRHRHEMDRELLGPAAPFWANRAASTAALLEELALEARSRKPPVC